MSDARELYARGAYWDAHEAWEDTWRAAAPGSPERARLAGLIQLCAAAIQAQRGRWRGVATLAVRAEQNLATLEPALAAAVRAWAARVVESRRWTDPPDLAVAALESAMAAPLVAKDLWPLVSKLPRHEQVELAKLALEAARGSGVSDADAYRAVPTTPDEFGSDEDPLSWDADGWDGIDAPGEIRWYTFAQPDKRRPVLLLTRDTVIDTLYEIIVAPATRTLRGLGTEVLLTPEDGMPVACAINLDHVSLAQRARLGAVLAVLPEARWPEIQRALLVACGFL